MTPEQQDLTYKGIQFMKEIAEKIADGADVPNIKASEFYQEQRERIKVSGIRTEFTIGQLIYMQGIRDRMRIPRKGKTAK